MTNTTLVQNYAKQKADSLAEQSFRSALKLFNQAAKRVPAYKEFLRQASIDPTKIKTEADFRLVPPVTKENYLKQFPTPDLLWDGDIAQAEIISMSSGSSGKPFFWFRGNKSTSDSVILHDRIFNTTFQTREKRTLFIVAFAMGTWIGGTYTLRALQELADHGHKIVSITPGINKQEIIYILQKIAPYFEQTIIGGYPPFVKDILDEAVNEKIDFRYLNTKLLFAGENFSEKWRDYVLEHIGSPDPKFTTAAIYGTADAGMLGHETPLSIYARRMACDNQELYDDFFPGATNEPTLVQYDPLLRYFETDDNDLIFSVNNSMPLLRYKILDKGRLVTGESLVNTLVKYKPLEPESLIEYADNPYIALYGRPDICTTFYAVKIYPENIKYGLEAKGMNKYITGKFVMTTEYEEATQQQSLHLYTELNPKTVPQQKIAAMIAKSVIEGLRKYNGEYHRLYQEIGGLADPTVHLLPQGSPEFDIRVKMKWTEKP